MTGTLGNAAPAVEAPEPTDPNPGYAGRLIRGAAAEVFGFGAAQAIRLGSNLVLTRLLFPEAFGLMAMLSVLLYGLTMLTDVGISQAVIRSEHADDPLFLDTAWSIQATRGLALWVIACLLTWPTALLFRERLLLWLIPIGSASTFIGGLQSTRTRTLRRRLQPLPVILLELGTQVLGVLIMIGLAWRGVGVWSLIAGNLSSALTLTAASHFLPGTHRPRLRSDPASRREIVHFGRWIYASSAVTFVAQRGDQFFLGRLLGAGSLGLYNIGLALAEMPESLANRIVGGIYFPMYARVHVESPGRLREVYYRTRLAFDAVAHTSLGGLIALAPWIIGLLYDRRYAGAAPMFQILALRSSLNIIVAPCENVLVSLGHSRYGFRRNFWVAVATMVALPLGYALGGTIGFLWGAALARVVAFPVLWPAARRLGLFDAKREALPGLFLATGYLVGRVILQGLMTI